MCLESSVMMTEDVNKGKMNVEMVQTDDSEVSRSVDMIHDSMQ